MNEIVETFLDRKSLYECLYHLDIAKVVGSNPTEVICL